MGDVIKQLPTWALQLLATVLLIILLYLVYMVSAGSALVTPWGNFGFAKKGYVPATMDWTEVASDDAAMKALAKDGFKQNCEYRMHLESDLAKLEDAAHTADRLRYIFETTGVGIPAAELVSKHTDFKGMYMYFNIIQQKFLMTSFSTMTIVVRSGSPKTATITPTGFITESPPILLEHRCPVANSG